MGSRMHIGVINTGAWVHPSPSIDDTNMHPNPCIDDTNMRDAGRSGKVEKKEELGE